MDITVILTSVLMLTSFICLSSFLENSDTMTPIVITVLLLSVAAVSPGSIHRYGKNKIEPVSVKIEKENANVKPGLNLTHGDIMGHMGDEEGILRNALLCPRGGCKWPKTGDEAIIPYEISRAFTKRQRTTIEKALRDFSFGERTTCIRFVRKTETDRNYLSFISDSGCWSYLGQTGGRQLISLQRDRCVHKNIVQHQALHALGFHHEQVRSDRDDYVIINYENIIQGAEQHFQIAPTNNLGTPYDYHSVMHFDAYAYSKNGKQTIIAKNRFITNFGRAKEMSDNDYARVNRLYECCE
ncbi:low choriolytic enzyme isoform X2 [Syngnathus scovelli]|uniref:low choriolytic enzyme isoform X2 n=1 Tax=Syngnathus scovelli TaxID=161590 RepID=UPI0021102F2C|nr:low choriolytic enzyme isoform X2 [Syngnathus scovelli]